MMVSTYADIFHGFGGSAIGAAQAGYRVLWGIEKDPDLASVPIAQGADVIVANVLDVDPGVLEVPTMLHASPPCPNFSIAKTNGRESDLDIALAKKVSEFIDVLRPRRFTLENVYQYRNSESWAIIRNTLYECGYWMDLAHVNAADFGVPQTRKRMIVRAVHGGWVPHLPLPEQWHGWYEAIEDLIPTLPDSELAPWQVKRLPGELREMVLLSQGISRDQKGNEYPIISRKAEEPAYTVTANTNQNQIRAFIVSNAATQFGDGARDADSPAFAVTQQSGGRIRAMLFQGVNQSSSVVCRDGCKPAYTVLAGQHKGMPRVWTSHRVVTLSPRCLARFQTFPDWFELPDSNTLACRGIGNAVPPLLYEKLARQLMEELT